MSSYDGISFKELEDHVNTNPTFEFVKDRLRRPAWWGDAWPFVTLQGRRAAQGEPHEEDSADSLVHY
eukprot:3632700-Pyramimonas_sp.AAC.1